jgi:hypothetical protein
MSSEASEIPAWLPYTLPLWFILVWLGVTGLLAEVSGWRRLARRYPGTVRPEGTRFLGQVASFGGVSENNVTFLVVSESGLYLYAFIVFRFLRPPILVPWREVAYVSEWRFLLWRTHRLRLGGTTSIWVKPKAYDALRPWLPSHGSGPQQ